MDECMARKAKQASAGIANESLFDSDRVPNWSTLHLGVFGGSIEQNVIPAQAGTQYSAVIQAFTGSPLARGRRLCVTAGHQPAKRKTL